MNRYISALLALMLSMTSASGAYAATATWTFDTANDYTYTDTLIEVTGGNAQLLETDAAELYAGGWDKRTPVTIDNSGNASVLTDYQVQVDITYDADMQADFDDIRFTNEDGILLDHWLETKVDSTSATFWVEADSIPSSGTGTIQMYYGSGSAASTSNGDNTFLIFDDFAGVSQQVLTQSGAQTLFASTGSGDWLGRPVLAEDDGTWIMVYRQGGLHGYDADAFLHIRFSEDEGATWTDADTFTDSNPVTGAPFESRDGNSAGVPLIIEAPNGDLVLQDGQTNSSNQVFGTYQYRSTDGGATWTDEGLINSDTEIAGGQDYTIVGSDIYATFWKDADSDGQPYQTLLYKSSDNGTTWTLISEITSTAENTDESGIEYLGNDTLLVVSREPTSNTTYQRISTDLGQTWGELTDIAISVGVLQRPRLRIFPDEPDRVYLYGRHYTGTNCCTVVYYSDDDGDTWSERFITEVTTYSDAGYSDLFKRADGNFYMVSYGGTHAAANLKEYTFGFASALRPDPAKWDRLALYATIEDSRVTFQETSTAYGPRRGILRSFISVDRPFIVEADYTVESNDHVHFWYGSTVHPDTNIMEGYTWWIDIDDPTNPEEDLLLYGEGDLLDDGGSFTALASKVDVSPDIANGEQFDQVFMFTSTGISISTNETTYIDVANTAHTSGPIGIGTGAGGTGSMDTIKVRVYTATEPTVSVGAETAFDADSGFYATSAPAIAPTAANIQTFASLSGFSTTETADGGDITYQISNDSGTTWYWYDGGWTGTSSGYSEANAASVINTNIGSLALGDGEFLFKAYLNSDGTQLVQLSDVSLTYASSAASSSSSSAGTSGGGGGGRRTRGDFDPLPDLGGEGDDEAGEQDACGSNLSGTRGFLSLEIGGRQITFRDVPLTAWFASCVRDIIRQGIASGYESESGALLGLYIPTNPVTYGELAKMAIEASEHDVMDAIPTNRLARSHWSSSYIAAAESIGLTIYTNTIDPNAPATRGEVIRTLLEAYDISLHDSAANPFSDLPSSHPHAQSILTAAALGILSGDTDSQGNSLGTVRPDDTINRAEIAKMIMLTGRVKLTMNNEKLRIEN